VCEHSDHERDGRLLVTVRFVMPAGQAL
jgi:hypothetical protein